MKLKAEIIERAGRIKLLLMDCDGVLTDGRIWLTADGEEQKAFHVHDGQGIRSLHDAGIKTGIISGRTSAATERRARDLGVTYLRQGIEDKMDALEEILREARVSAAECAYIGDDLIDIPLMRRAGLPIAVANASEPTKEVAAYVTVARGGQGAVREVCDLILKQQR